MLDKFKAMLARKNGNMGELKETAINNMIRKKYTISQELAILRQRDTKPAEFKEYNDYVEECKERVKEVLSAYE